MEQLFLDPDENIFHFRSIDIRETEKSGDHDGVTVVFHYSINSQHHFESPLLLDKRWTKEEVDAPPVRRILFCIGMSVLPWFYFGYGCKTVAISRRKVADLDEWSLAFWQETYDEVLREYFYLNKLEHCVKLVLHDSHDDGDDEGERGGGIAGTSGEEKVVFSRIAGNSTAPQVLVPIGGGKDSLVVLHECQSEGKDVHLLYVADGEDEFEDSWRLRKIMKLGSNGDESRRSLCRHVFYDQTWLQVSRTTLTEEGHPWAMLVLFDSLLIACLLNIPTISLGFEKSADFGNGVYFNGAEVNHQYDKSSIFLSRANAYIERNITEHVKAVSPLAHLWELDISRTFCEHTYLKRFHGIFLSCNEPVDDTRWCAKCDKCCFVYLLMSAFLPQREVWSIFGENLFEKEALVPVFLRLVGEAGPGQGSCNANMSSTVSASFKPFDCVGEAWEAAASAELAIRRFSADVAIEGPPFEMPAVVSELCRVLDITGKHWNDASCTEDQIILTWLRKKGTQNMIP